MDMTYSQGKEVKRKQIEMPPLEEINQVSQSLANDSAPNIKPKEVVFNEVPELPEYPEESQTEQSVVDNSPEYEEDVQEVEEAPKPVKQVKNKEDNFAELRKAREAAERRAEKLERQQELLMEQLLNQHPKSSQKKLEEEYDYTIDDDDLSTGKDIKKTNSKIQALEQRLKNMQEEARIRAKYPDLDQVVTDENIYLLRTKEPEIAQSLNMAPDSWDKLAAVYTMIKKTGIHKTHNYDSQKIQAATNSNKPKPLASIAPQTADTPLSRANAFAVDYKQSREQQNNTWREMQAAMKKG
jgi:hypothetical protein